MITIRNMSIDLVSLSVWVFVAATSITLVVTVLRLLF
jgi:hypothetical protein